MALKSPQLSPENNAPVWPWPLSPATALPPSLISHRSLFQQPMNGCHCGSILDFINVSLSPGQRCWRPCQSFLLPFRAQLLPPCGYMASFQSCRPGWDSATCNLSGSGGQCPSVTWTPPSLLPLGLPCPLHSVRAGGWTLACHQKWPNWKKGWKSSCRSRHSQAPQEDGVGGPHSSA